MPLSDAQLPTLKAAIVAGGALYDFPMSADGDAEIRKILNSIDPQPWVIWHSAVTAAMWAKAILRGGTQLDGLSQSKRDSLLWACDRTLDCTDSVVRAAIDDYCGTQNTLKAELQAVQKRNATRGQRVFSTGTGTSASPATSTYEFPLTDEDVHKARALP